MKWARAAWAALPLALVARHTGAQEATAQALFEAGRELMDQGRHAEACPKLAESQRLDPAGGTLLNLALCHEMQGLTATAWGEFKTALGVARRERRDDRIAFATEHIALLEPKLSRVVIVVPESARVPGLSIEKNGVAVKQPTWGVAVPTDPGTVRVLARAPGRVEWQTSLELRGDAHRLEVTLPELAAATEGEPHGRAAEPPARDAVAPVEVDDTQIVAGYITGAIGAAAVIVGAVFGGRAIALDDDADALCGEDSCPTPEGASLSDDARLHATLSNVFIGVGAGLLGVGLVVVLTAPGEPDEVAVTLQTRGAGAEVRVAW